MGKGGVYARKAGLTSVGIAILVVTLWRIGFDKIADSLAEARIEIVLASLVFLFIATGARLFRWDILLKEASFKDASKIFLVGQAVNLLAPLGSGEVTRAYIAKKKFNIKMGKSFAAIFIEKLCEITFVATMAVLAIVFLLGGGPEADAQTHYVYLMIVPLSMLVLGFVILLRPKVLAAFSRFFLKREGEGFISKALRRIGKTLESMERSILDYRDKKGVVGLAFLATVTARSMEGFGQFMILWGLGITENPMLLIVILSASWLIGFFTFIPGGLGAREVVSIALMGAIGIPLEIAATASILYRLMTYIRTGTLGAWGMSALPDAHNMSE